MKSVWMNGGRVAFVVITVFFAWWSLRGRWSEVGEALVDTPWWGVVLGLVLVLAGLIATGFVWLRLLAAHGHRIPVRGGLAIFFVGQLGKYVPGSVWSIGAQAQMARRYDVPVRSTVNTSLVFIGFHVATGVVLGGVVALFDEVDPRLPQWIVVLGVVGAVVGMLPPVLNRITKPIAPGVQLRWSDLAVVFALLAFAWLGYALALLVIVPDPSVTTLVALAAAFALAYAVGVVIIFAPAGLGAREATFVLLLTPVTGVVAATGVAVLARVLHTVADFTLAGVAWILRER